MDTEKVTKLQEMGFSAEMAEDALRSSENDLEKAIAYLFGEPIEVKPEPAAEPPHNYQDTVAILNAEDIPRFDQGGKPYYDDRYYDQPRPQPPQLGPSFPDNFNAYSGSQTLLDTRQVYEPRYDGNIDSDHEHIEDIEPVVDIFDQGTFKRNGNPPAILPRSALYVENLVIPFLIIVSQVNLFKKIVLKDTDFDYGYDENWYNHKSKMAIQLEEENEEKRAALRFIIEVQRAFLFLSPLSNRLFTGSANLLKNLPSDFKSDLANSIEDADELFPKFYASLNTNFGLLGESGVEKLFKSRVESGVEEDENDLFVLPIELESRGSNIYQSLNSMFWCDDESIGTIRFVQIAPIITIQVCGEEDRYRLEHFLLDEVLYPEIYLAKFSTAIIEMDRKRHETNQLRSTISNQIMALNSFEGKKIKKVIQNTIGHLSKENSEAFDDLTNLAEQMNKETEQLTNKLSQINSSYASLDLTNPQAILDNISSDPTFGVPTPYHLIGIIFSDTEYFYKSKANPHEDWVYFKALYGHDNKVYDYSMETMEFESVRMVVAERTRDSTQNMFLFYANGEQLIEEEVEVSDRLKSFFEKDNDVLEVKDEEMDSSDDEGPQVIETSTRKVEGVNTEKDDESRLLDL